LGKERQREGKKWKGINRGGGCKVERNGEGEEMGKTGNQTKSEKIDANNIARTKTSF